MRDRGGCLILICCVAAIGETHARVHVNVTIRDSASGANLAGLAAEGYDLVSVSETYELGEVVVEIDVVPTPTDNANQTTPVPVASPTPVPVMQGTSTAVVAGGTVVGVVVAGSVLAVLTRAQRLVMGVPNGIMWPSLSKRVRAVVPFHLSIPAGMVLSKEGKGTDSMFRV